MTSQANTNFIQTWNVEIGSSIHSFLDGIPFLLDEESKNGVLRETTKILSRCSNPQADVSRRSILVLGEVQSGKTLSFTSLIALARDNKIPVSVVLAGTKRPLMKQNYEQLVIDLNRNSSGTAPQWLITSDSKATSQETALKSLRMWFDGSTPIEFKKSVVLVAMKTPAGIRKVRQFIMNLQRGLDRTIPTLIIDDEGDQASPNTKVAQDEFSATYSAISELRDSLQNHTFISYTATPEANLLLSLSDHLSPESVVVLSPGDAYVGGYRLFVDRSTSHQFVKLIPDDELAVARKPQFGDLPPTSLSGALAYFLVCMTVVQKGYSNVRPVSMLIHPDSTINSHTQYKKWVHSIISKWILHFEENDPNGPGYQIPREFVNAITELRQTVGELERVFPEMDAGQQNIEIMRLVRFWIRPEYLEVRIINSERKAHDVAPKEWSSRAGWILIGAGKLDRGFVVKNLAVTYMPRGIGGGNVDTIQQRGRFFGYKAHYIELLRGWFSRELIDSYAAIVETEKDLRDKLRKYDKEERHLSEWNRSMILDPALTATRKNIISLNHSTLNLRAGSWFQQRQLCDPYLNVRSGDIRESLEDLFRVSQISSLDTRQTYNKHRYLHLELPKVVQLLFDWPMASGDREILNKYLILLTYFAEHQRNTSATLFLMNANEEEKDLEVRRRKLDLSKVDANSSVQKLWKIQNLHEGPRNSGRANYLGDKSIRSNESISLQIHKVVPHNEKQDFPECYAVAISWPDGFERKVLEQIR